MLTYLSRAGHSFRGQPLLQVMVAVSLILATSAWLTGRMAPLHLSAQGLAQLDARLCSREQSVRQEALNEIALMGSEASGLVPRLARMLHDEPFPILTATVLAQIGPRALAALAEAGLDPNAEVRRACATGLGLLQGAPGEVEAQLTRLISDSDSRVRTMALASLSNLPAIDQKLLNAVTEMTRDPDPWLAALAQNACMRFSWQVADATHEREGRVHD